MKAADLKILIHEKPGAGIKRIRDEAREGGYPEPVWEANGFVTTIFRPSPAVRAAATAQPAPGGDQVGIKSAPSRNPRKVARGAAVDDVDGDHRPI